MPSDSKRAIAAWITTGLFALLTGVSGALYIVGPRPVVEGFHHLGYPDYFRTILGVAKLLGVAVLLGSKQRGLREWAYAGFTFDLVAAVLSHAVQGDGPAIVSPLVVLGLLAGSYTLRQRPRASGESSARDERAPAGGLAPAATSRGGR